MNKPKDTDLREAMRRMYADTPQLPSDFMERMHQAQEKENKRRTLRRWLYPISIGAVAASLLLLFFFNHSGDQPTERPLVAKQKTEATQPNNVKEEPQPTVEDTQTATEVVRQNATVEHIEKAQVAQHKPAKKAKKRNRTMPQVQQHPFTTLHPTHTLRWPPKYRTSEHEANACIRKWHYSWITYKNMDNL